MRDNGSYTVCQSIMDNHQLNSDEFEFPLQISTHEKCSNPCPEFRERASGREEFEFIGMWGPLVETATGEKIAEGHKGVRIVLNAVLGVEIEPTRTDVCGIWDCDNEATHTVEIKTEYKRFTDYRCSECIGPSEFSVAVVDEGLETKTCDNGRCFNVVHESRAYCTSHEN